MKVIVSNIAWEPGEDAAVAAVLRREHVEAIELAPTKWREDALDASAADLDALWTKWHDLGLRIVSLQSLLFGRPELQLFGDAASRAAMMRHLRRSIDFAAAIQARTLVFGSPKNRIRGAMPMGEATTIAREFFHELGEYAFAHTTRVCLEANPPEYGCDFLTTTPEAVALARQVDHPGIGVNIDLGGIQLAGENARDSIELAGDLALHVHASEPNLAELASSVHHTRAAEALRALAYRAFVSIEMRAVGSGGNVAAVERAVRLAKVLYG